MNNTTVPIWWDFSLSVISYIAASALVFIALDTVITHKVVPVLPNTFILYMYDENDLYNKLH